MSKIDEVRADMVKAMKAKDKDTKETLSMLLAALKNKAIDKREDPDTGRRDSGNLKKRSSRQRDPGYDSCRSYRDHRRMQQASGCSGTVCS